MNASSCTGAVLFASLAIFTGSALAQGIGGAGITSGGSPSATDSQTLPNGAARTFGQGAANANSGARSHGTGMATGPSNSTRSGHSNSDNYTQGTRPQTGAQGSNGQQ